MPSAPRKHERVAGRVAALIESGTLKAGHRVPSVREMARQMGVSVMTVLEGYGRLESQGIIMSRPQSGYYVRPAPLRNTTASPHLPLAQTDPIHLVEDAVRIPEMVWALLAQTARPDLIPLGSGAPSPALLPSQAMARALSAAARRNPVATNQYAVGPGLPRLRQQLAQHMMEAGCTVAPDDVLVTVGATEALQVALQALVEPGDSVAVESPGYLGFYAVLERLRVNVVEIESDPTLGISLPMLRQALEQHRRLRAVVLCATNSNPTGATLPLEHRTALVSMCRQAGVSVVEDDTFGHLTFQGTRPQAMKALDPDNVVYLGSLSKILSPGYRIGWVCGGRHHQEVLRHHLMSVLAVPTACQAAAASFLGGGGFARHLRRLRDRLEENASLFRLAIARAFPPQTRVTHPNGGFFLWVEMPVGNDACRIAQAAVHHGFTVASGRMFSSRGHFARFMRLNTAVPWNDGVEQALATLGALVSGKA